MVSKKNPDFQTPSYGDLWSEKNLKNPRTWIGKGHLAVKIKFGHFDLWIDLVQLIHLTLSHAEDIVVSICLLQTTDD